MRKSEIVRIEYGVVKRACEGRPDLWDALWSVGRLEGTFCEIGRGDFDRICREHFSPFAPGEIIHKVAAAVGLQECGGCASRRLVFNRAAGF
jgi:hypothetical protein